MNQDTWKKGIPKIMHQMWLDKHIEDSKSIPDKYLPMIETFNKLNPNVKREYWNTKMVKYLFTNEPKLAKWKDFWLYKLAHHIERCDFARYAIMYIIGGIYMDLDVWTVSNFDKLLDTRQVGITWEPVEHWAQGFDDGPRRLWNGFLCSIPGHWIWAEYMDFIVERYKDLGPLKTTGPIAFCLYALKKEWKPPENLNESLRPQPEEIFLSTCDIIPVFHTGGLDITRYCPQNSLSNAITYTKWSEGSGWGEISVRDQISSANIPEINFENVLKYINLPENQPLKDVKLPQVASKRSNNLFIILSIVFSALILVLLIVLLVLLFRKKKKLN